MNVGAHLQPTQSNRLQVAQHARNFLRLALGAPLSTQAGAQPIGQKAEANMVDHPVWSPVMDGADFPVALEFAKRLFHVQQPLVVTQHLLARTLLDRFIGVQQIPAVLLGFLGDHTQAVRGGGGESGHLAQMGCVHRLQIDPTAHPPIEHESRLLDPKATAQGVQEARQRLGIVAIASQERQLPAHRAEHHRAGPLRVDFDGLRIFFDDPVLPDNGYEGQNWHDDFRPAL